MVLVDLKQVRLWSVAHLHVNLPGAGGALDYEALLPKC